MRWETMYGVSHGIVGKVYIERYLWKRECVIVYIKYLECIYINIVNVYINILNHKKIKN